MQQKRFEQQSEFKERTVFINRVAKVVKGGRNFRFSALMVVGDEKGRVGVGMGKAKEVPEAIRKGTEDAKRQMVKVAVTNGTVPHEIVGRFGTTKVKLIPAPEGTGLIAGSAVRAVLEAVGVRNVRTKSYGSNNVVNMAKATMVALEALKTPEQTAALRGKTVEELLG